MPGSVLHRMARPQAKLESLGTVCVCVCVCCSIMCVCVCVAQSYVCVCVCVCCSIMPDSSQSHGL